MNLLYLLLLAAALFLLRRAHRRLPPWFSNGLAGSAVLLAAVFFARELLRSVDATEASVTILCLAGVAVAEAYWLSAEELRP